MCIFIVMYEKAYMRFFTWILLFLSVSSFGQSLQEGQKLWHPSEPLTIADFKMSINDTQNESVYSQFSISSQLSGFSFLSKNLNQKVLNIFMGEASWVNSAIGVDEVALLEFQQLQFDLCEVYTRNFRKEALIGKKEVLKGFDFLQILNNKIMSDFARERARLIEETKSGSHKEKVIAWKHDVAVRLDSLHDFRYANKKKIKIARK